MLAPGTKLGPYEVVGPLGAGGMGEVYRAKDARLGRDVAIKVLPQHLSANEEVRARFEREAKAIASLNHPNICSLFDVGREGDTDFLVMELVEGETLAARLLRGALPTPDVLRIGAQVADALDRAHRAGVIHRDLKPANVMLTKSGAKLMDFGLARATGMAGPGGGSGVSMSSLTQSPTIARALTAEGTIVGTFQYMPPEQLEGGEADARSDLWALGCVLYEMATGRRAFDGRSQASLISSIMKEQPAPLLQVAPASPPGLDRLIARCLAKDPDDRWQTARDLMHELRALDPAAPGTSTASGVSAAPRVPARRSGALPWAIAALAIAAAVVLAFVMLAGRSGPRRVVQLTLLPAEGTILTPYTSVLQLSPDGRNVAYAARDSAGVPSVYVHALDGTGDVRLVAEPRGAILCWSPDSRSLAVGSFGGERAVIVPATGGSPTELADVKAIRGIAWNRRGTLLYGGSTSGPLLAAPAAGGAPVQATWLDSTRHEAGHRFPCFLPDGRHFLYAALPQGPDGFAIFAGELGSRKVRHVMDAGSAPIYAEPGYLLFRRGDKLTAQRFDAAALALKGDPVAIADLPSQYDVDAEPVVSASNDGKLVMLDRRRRNLQLEWWQFGGPRLGELALPAGHWVLPVLSPDDRSALALDEGDLWRVDLERAVATRLTTSGQVQPGAVWSPDGRRVAYSERHGREQIMVMNSDGSGSPRTLVTTDDNFKNPECWTRSGLVFQSIDPVTFRDQWITGVDGESPPRPLARTPFSEASGRVSPDGRWLAYTSTEAGNPDVYVQAFPGLGHKVRVSSDGANALWWMPGSDEIVYTSPSENAIMGVKLERRGDDLVPGPARRVADPLANAVGADLTHDGRRVLVSLPRTGGTPPTMRVILDWTAMVKR